MLAGSVTPSRARASAPQNTIGTPGAKVSRVLPQKVHRGSHDADDEIAASWTRTSSGSSRAAPGCVAPRETGRHSSIPRRTRRRPRARRSTSNESTVPGPTAQGDSGPRRTAEARACDRLGPRPGSGRAASSPTTHRPTTQGSARRPRNVIIGFERSCSPLLWSAARVGRTRFTPLSSRHPRESAHPARPAESSAKGRPGAHVPPEALRHSGRPRCRPEVSRA